MWSKLVTRLITLLCQPNVQRVRLVSIKVPPSRDKVMPTPLLGWSPGRRPRQQRRHVIAWRDRVILQACAATTPLQPIKQHKPSSCGFNSALWLRVLPTFSRFHSAKSPQCIGQCTLETQYFIFMLLHFLLQCTDSVAQLFVFMVQEPICNQTKREVLKRRRHRIWPILGRWPCPCWSQDALEQTWPQNSLFIHSASWAMKLLRITSCELFWGDSNEDWAGKRSISNFTPANNFKLNGVQPIRTKYLSTYQGVCAVAKYLCNYFFEKGLI